MQGGEIAIPTTSLNFCGLRCAGALCRSRSALARLSGEQGAFPRSRRSDFALRRDDREKRGRRRRLLRPTASSRGRYPWRSSRTGWPVASAKILFRRSFILMISRAWISMSDAMPRVPPDGWCSRKRVFGRQMRRSFGAATKISAPAEATQPVPIIQTFGLMNLIMSWMQIAGFDVTARRVDVDADILVAGGGKRHELRADLLRQFLSDRP